MAKPREKAEKLIAHLEGSVPLHHEIIDKMWKADGGKVFPVDFLATAAIHRSLGLISGFVLLLKAENFTAAAPLLRLQLDNCLRFYGVFLVKDCHAFAQAVLKGEQVNKMASGTGEQMTDRYLVRTFGKDKPWISSIYSNTSAYIHLSEKHFYLSMVEHKGTQVQFEVGEGENFVPDVIYCEAIEAMTAVTAEFMNLVIGWVKTKERGPLPR